jgi:hypothetical protein
MAFDQGHALVIGVGTYPYAPRLNTAQITAKDAQEVAMVLGDATFCGYPQHQILLLHDEQATRANILSALDRLAKDTDEGDTVLIFYSGHGEYGEDGYYLTTYDTTLNTSHKVVKDGGVREAELLEKIKNIKAKRALLVFNACHSGEISPQVLGEGAVTEDQATGQSVPKELAAALLGTGEGRVIITACRESQKSYFIRNSRATIFAQALTDGLHGKEVVNRRGYISVFDLYEYIFDTVSARVRDTWELVQEPELTISKGVGVMAVALHRGKPAQGVLGGEEDGPAKLGGTGIVHVVDPQESRQKLEQILSGKLNLAAGRDITAEKFVLGDEVLGLKIDASEALGSIGQNFGQVEQIYGEKRVVNVTGDYAKGDIDKREGIFGGTFHGTAIGVTKGGTINIGQPAGSAHTGITLQQAHELLMQAVAQAEKSSADDLADRLRHVEIDLKAALRAESRGDSTQRQAKLQQVKQSLQELAMRNAHLRELSDTVQQVP